MRKIVLIGASGFLGSYVREELHQQNDKILLVENRTVLTAGANERILKGGITALTSEVLNEFQADLILHCARPGSSRFKQWGRKQAAKKAHQLNTHLLEVLDQSGFKGHLVFASGSLTYGNSILPHDEDSIIDPISYARQYFKGEQILHDVLDSSNFPIIILKFPWLLGNGSWFKWFYLENIKKHKALPLFGEGHNQMSIINVRDAAILMLKYAESSLSSGIYNVFSPNSQSQLNFLKLIQKEVVCEITDWQNIYKNKLEHAIIEAFESNIELRTKYDDLLNKHSFNDLESSIKHLLSDI